MLPRIRGKVGQAIDPPHTGKWFFEIWLSPFGSGDVTPEESLGQFGPWDNEEKAHAELKRASQLACEAVEKSVDGKVSGKYIDMKTNLTKHWDKRDEH